MVIWKKNRFRQHQLHCTASLKQIIMSWSWKITLVYIGFATMILTLVFKSTQENYEMVTTDYYKKEQLHQEKIDGAKRVQSEKLSVITTVVAKGVQLIFPRNITSIQKNIEVYCPTDQNKDKNIHTTESALVIPLLPAKYKLKISWTNQGKSYYQEKEIWVK